MKLVIYQFVKRFCKYIFFSYTTKHNCVITLYSWIMVNFILATIKTEKTYSHYIKAHLVQIWKLIQLSLHPAFQKLPSSSPRLMRILEHLTLLSPGDLISYSEALTASMALLLEPAVPRRILQTLNKLWMGLNTVMPRRYVLWTRFNVVTKDFHGMWRE